MGQASQPAQVLDKLWSQSELQLIFFCSLVLAQIITYTLKISRHPSVTTQSDLLWLETSCITYFIGAQN